MTTKLFISYNHKDEEIIDTIARRLDIEFGRSNIFYDKWSITPGESIIGKMDDGLTEFDTFFFFMSKNSLNSNMVRLEWQTALNRAVNYNLKFVGIKLDDSQVPIILSDKLYIDLYNDGIDNTVSKMKLVINNESTYKPLEDFNNLHALITPISNYQVEIEVLSKRFAEHNTVIAIGFDVDFDSIITAEHHENVVLSGKNEIEMQDDGEKFNCLVYTLQRVLKPGYPFKIMLKSNTVFKRMAIFTEKTREGDIAHYEVIPSSSK